MKLKIDKPIVFFDTETTGTNIVFDRIIEIGAIKLMPDGNEVKKSWLINPGCPIPQEASDVHKITDDMVKNKPFFRDVAREVHSFIKGCDLAGYNSDRFDIPLLMEEFLRSGIEIDLVDFSSIDVQTVFYKKEPRDLSAAYKFYCGKELLNAHSALIDTEATLKVFKKQLERYDDIGDTVKDVSKFTTRRSSVDLVGRIVYNGNGDECFNFGKYKGQEVEKVFKKDPGYFGWMVTADFPKYTKRVVSKIRLRMIKKELV